MIAPLRILEHAKNPERMAIELERVISGMQYDVSVASRAAGIIPGSGGTVSTGAVGAGTGGSGGGSGAAGGGGSGGSGTGGGGNTPAAPSDGGVVAYPAESGIGLGSLVHVRGLSAYLATASSRDRYATGIVSGMSFSSQLKVTNFGPVQVYATVFASSDASLWLSSVPGWASDTEPAEGTGLLSQKIGIKASNAPVAGKCLALAQILGWNIQ